MQSASRGPELAGSLQTPTSLDLQSNRSGLGLFTDPGALESRVRGRWWQRPWHWFRPHSGDVEVAAFPMHLAATARTVLADPVIGPAYQQLLDSGKHSTHTAVVADASCAIQLSAELHKVLRCWIVHCRGLLLVHALPCCFAGCCCSRVPHGLSAGNADDRELVMTFLVVER